MRLGLISDRTQRGTRIVDVETGREVEMVRSFTLDEPAGGMQELTLTVIVKQATETAVEPSETDAQTSA